MLLSVAAAFPPNTLPNKSGRRGETKRFLDHPSKSTFSPDARVDRNDLSHGVQENSTLEFTEFNITEELEPNGAYNWKEFSPKGGGVRGYLKKARWLITGYNLYARQSDEQVQQNLSALARLLILLRAYELKFGVPPFCRAPSAAKTAG